MAITDIQAFAHLSDADIEALGRELDAIRAEVETSRGQRDATYIKRAIHLHRTLEVGGRLALFASNKRGAWWAGAGMLGIAKIIENMELGHNIMHGQWDWMNDPETHSASWEWDNVGPSAHWKQTHNYLHHKYTNILGMDDDVGYGLIRVTRDRKWKPFNSGNLVYNTLLMMLFEYGVAIQHVELGKVFSGRADKAETKRKLGEVGTKLGKQALKDYVFFPVLAGKAWKTTLTANIVANLIRNVWTNAVIFCGHFPDGAEKFTKADMKNETRGQWYLRQMLGSANFNAGPVLAFMSGNLSYQIEHHLFPDLPSNRYAEIAGKVRQLCDKYDLPYTTGSFPLQYLKAWRTIAKLSLPDRFLTATPDNAPETASERMFAGMSPESSVTTQSGRSIGLRTAIGQVRGNGRRRSYRNKQLATS
ncbi:MAG: fatty acid desaturase family protein [Mycobacteriaceae bacterium]